MPDQFVMFPMNENGVFWSPKVVGQTLQDAMSDPFRFSDVFIYSHGWCTEGNAAMVTYGQYTVEFARNLLNNKDDMAYPPEVSFGVGIHWPSAVSEDQGVIQKALDPVSYYQMGARAQHVGQSGLYAALSLLFNTRYAANKSAISSFLRDEGVADEPGKLPGSFTMTLLGHSFGCRVICSALERVCDEISKSATEPEFRRFIQNLRINVVLLQAAYKKNELSEGGNYEQVNLDRLPFMRMLITTSQLDKALNYWFPIAEDINNISHLMLPDAIALGAGVGAKIDDERALSPGGGPPQAVADAFGAPPVVPVGHGFTMAQVPTNNKMLVADLTQVHEYRLQSGDYIFDELGGGSHSDISSPEIYNLISGFCFN